MFHFLPIAVRYDGQKAAVAHGYQVHVGPMRTNPPPSKWLDAAAPVRVKIHCKPINGMRLISKLGCNDTDSEFLKSKGIEPRVHLPGVGENFEDHLEVYIQHKCKAPTPGK
jgi:hypothetical protein